jgi:hypothetical protein
MRLKKARVAGRLPGRFKQWTLLMPRALFTFVFPWGMINTVINVVRRKRILYLAIDRAENNQQLRRRLIGWGIPVILLLACIIAVFVKDLGIKEPSLRHEWLISLLSVTAGALGIFAFGMFISPVLSYRKLLNNVLNGRTRAVQGTFKSIGGVPVMRDGVRVYPVTISAGNPADEADDRLLYYDANKPLPGWRAGQALAITAHDKTIAAFTAAE